MLRVSVEQRPETQTDNISLTAKAGEAQPQQPASDTMTVKRANLRAVEGGASSSVLATSSFLFLGTRWCGSKGPPCPPLSSKHDILLDQDRVCNEEHDGKTSTQTSSMELLVSIHINSYPLAPSCHTW